MTRSIEYFLNYLQEADFNSRGDGSGKKLISFVSETTGFYFKDILDNLYQQKADYFYWEKPDESHIFLGIGSILSIEKFGPDRTELSRAAIEEWLHQSYNNFSEAGLKSVPLFMGGMKFSPEGNSSESIWNDFSDSDWFIPKFIFLKCEHKSYIVFNIIRDGSNEGSIKDVVREYDRLLSSVMKQPANNSRPEIINSNLHDDIERSNWIEKVNSALKQIEEGSYSKIVLSRRVELELSTTPKLSEKVKALSADYPKCYIFAYGKNDSVFFGASPEKLAKIKNGWVEADALAGSIQRGDSAEDDKRLADELLLSKKNLSEQMAVVDFITNSFSGFSNEIIYDEKPIIRKLSNIQHLWTPIKAKLKEGNTIFSILKEIHPTPAICGVPWSGALDFIKTTEGYNRGLYAGIIGWFNFDEQGEFAVSIRSGLLKENKLYAFAGCGIVEGSDPDAEFEETELKLKPILSLFPDEKVIQS